MDEKLQSELNRAVALFHTFDSVKPIRIVSHLDADGISAASILINALDKESRKHSTSIVAQLSKEKLKDFANEDYEYYFFTDLGSGHISLIEQLFQGKKVIILDHHEPEQYEPKDKNIIIVNPHKFGIDGSKTVSGAGVVFFFTKTLNQKYEDMAHIAIIGAIGDMQENQGFTGLNQEILDIAIKYKKIIIKKGLKCFGQQSRPLYKVLEYSSDPYIPGVTNSESGAIQFLIQIGIKPKKDKEWKKISDLTHNELQKLIAGIILKRSTEEHPEDIIGNIYILPHEEPDSPLRDVREFSTLLNSCGRTNRASLGIGVCLNNQDVRDKAMKNQNTYRKEIVKALKWYENNDDKIIKGNGYKIINAENNVLYTIVGTLASILAKGNSIEPNTYILSMARNLEENQTKISLRYSGRKKDLDLHSILTKIISKTGGETGGHANAAGAVIKTELEQDFISEAQEVFDNV